MLYSLFDPFSSAPLLLVLLLFSFARVHPDLHSFPTRRSSDLDLFNVADTPIITAHFYQYLIFGIPTWDYGELQEDWEEDRKSTRLNSSHVAISYAVVCLKKKNKKQSIR